MKPWEHPLYLEDVAKVAANESIPWERLAGKSVIVSGASGLVGSCLTDVLMRRNIEYGLDCRVVGIARNPQRSAERFARYFSSPLFVFLARDINSPLDNVPLKADFVLHLASNTHPLAYATRPVETVLTNIIGLRTMLDFAVHCGAERFAFASSNEIYGRNRGDAELFDEKYCGYIDCNTLRAGYSESKRCGEALCQAYAAQYSLDVVIPRLTRCFGPTLLKDDSKALSQFLHNAASGEDIVLKSDGKQYFSYIYVADAVSGLLSVLLKGSAGEAYNVSAFDVTLRNLAERVASIAGTKVVFDLPSETEKAGFSTATKARLDPSKLRSLGWSAAWSLEEGLEHTIAALSTAR